MLSKENKLEILEQVISSNTFKNAPTSIALLKYLVTANIEERPLKESIIDIEFFASEQGVEKSNPRVRVNVYNLRNKLASYYEDEGLCSEWQIIIDKGQYGARFEEIHAINTLGEGDLVKNRKIIHLFRYIVPAALIIVAFIFFVFPKQNSVIWKDFISNGHKTNLFIGDAFGYGGKTVSGLDGWTRDFSINSLNEYYKMLEEKPELKPITKPTVFNYSTRMAENATHDLTRLFTKMDSDFEIKYATQTSFSDIKEGNTIYVGRMKDQKDFVYLFNEANKYFKIKDRIIEFSGHEEIPDTSIVYITNGIDSDYTVVSRVAGPNNTEQFLFFSDHDIGVMATVEFFTNQDSLKSFTKKYLPDTPYFTAIYKAKGKERINLDLETVMVVAF